MTPPPNSAIARAWFEIDFAYENYTTTQGAASYVLKNPRVVSPDGPVYIHDVHIFLDGKYHSEYGEAYQNVDQVVDTWIPGSGCSIPPAPTPFDPNALSYPACLPAVPALFSTAASASGILQVNDPATGNPDQIGFSFDYFQPGVVGNCKEQALWYTNVYTPIKIGAVACLNCHRSGGMVTEAGQRFNMDDTDPANGPDPTTAQQVICQRFMQRANLGQPSQSAIIVQPLQGLNGMPAQPNFNYFEPKWIEWISSEAKDAGITPQ
jgi:hypothetical protein